MNTTLRDKITVEQAENWLPAEREYIMGVASDGDFDTIQRNLSSCPHGGENWQSCPFCQWD